MKRRGLDSIFKWFGICSFILILCAALFSGGSRRTVAYVAVDLLLVYFLVILWRRFFRPRASMVFAARVVAIIAGLCYYRFFSAEGILASHGVHFDSDAVAYASPNLNSVQFWYERDGKTMTGPELTGDLLFVDRAYTTPDGHAEVIVRSRSPMFSTDYLRIQLIDPPAAGAAFKVMPDSTFYESVFYPPQGLQGSP